MKRNIVIRGGQIVDGTGRAAYEADLSINSGKIEEIGNLGPRFSYQEIDARGLTVAPGFIDAHSHSDLILLKEDILDCKIRQGVTCEVLGQDGLSVFPLNERNRDLMPGLVAGLLGHEPADRPWNSLSEYSEALQKHGVSSNYALLVPHGTVRAAVMGMETRAATDAEIGAMVQLVEEGMRQGAVGLSTGLYYVPCGYADRRELLALAAAVGRFDGPVVVHIRNESENLLSALREMCDICLEAGARLHISHYKVMGHANWGLVKEGIKLISDYMARGLSVTFDQYPYTAGSTSLISRLPPWAMEGGLTKALERCTDPCLRTQIKAELKNPATEWENRALVIGWENTVISSVVNPENFALVGKNISQIAQEQGKEAEDVFLDMLVSENSSPSIITFMASEEDVATVMRHPQTMVCTDGIPGLKPHPRLYGTFPRILGYYVREKKVLSLEEAVRKMTSLPARTFRLGQRGELRPGWAADLVLFNAQTVCDNASYENPCAYSSGIEWVFVNGEAVVSPQHIGANGAGRYLQQKQS